MKEHEPEHIQDAEETERQEYSKFEASRKKEKPAEMGSLGALLKAKMAEKKK